jgi:hypothetical protein
VSLASRIEKTDVLLKFVNVKSLYNLSPTVHVKSGATWERTNKAPLGPRGVQTAAWALCGVARVRVAAIPAKARNDEERFIIEE